MPFGGERDGVLFDPRELQVPGSGRGAPVVAAQQYSVIMSMTPVVAASAFGSRNGRKKRSSPGASRSQSTVSTRLPLAARIQAVLARAIVRPVPPLYE